MAYEKRGSKVYYYRAKKRNGRVIKEYIGRGERAKRAAAKDEQKKSARQRERAERQGWEVMDSQIAQLHQFTTLLTQSHLVSAGLYRHHRGEWRQKRG